MLSGVRGDFWDGRSQPISGYRDRGNLVQKSGRECIDPEAFRRSQIHPVPPLHFRPIVTFLNSIRQIPLV
jgi:hypothetical protein